MNKRPRGPVLRKADGSLGIPLSNGLYAWVDSTDAGLVAKFLWRFSGRYAQTDVWPDPAVLMMHRLILGLPPGRMPEVDHVDGDGLNNRRANLRTATRHQNARNVRRHRGGKSRFKGILPAQWPVRNPWVAQIYVGGKSTHLGCFPTEEEAAIRYNVAARKYFGEFARLNVVEMG